MSELDILSSFIGVTLALLSASVVWLGKSAYEKHRREMLALAKYERTFVTNLTLLKENSEFVSVWIGALRANRAYSFHFQSYMVNDADTYSISDLGLINKILSANYKLTRTGLDLENIYKGYWDTVHRIESNLEGMQVTLCK